MNINANPRTGDAEDANPSQVRSMVRAAELQSLSPRALEDRRLIHRSDPTHLHADAFRDLRTRLLALGGDRNFVTLVAPVVPGCGGSFVARNLAAAFAFDETKTSTLIDCDALRPAQQGALGVDAANGGLMDYLDGHIIEVAPVQYRTVLPRMDLVPTGGVREITGESFSSLRMRNLVDSLRSTHGNRYLVLDGPPVLKSPDARILSDLVDLVVLVAGYGRVTTEQIEKAAANFDPEKLIGIVFNDIQ
ncbi:MAG: polysaccharide biosynthesis protein [Pseudoxanthomonas sp.]